MEGLHSFTMKNFAQMAKTVQQSQIKPQLVEATVKRQLIRNSQCYRYPARLEMAYAHQQAAYGRNAVGDQICVCCGGLVDQSEGPKLSKSDGEFWGDGAKKYIQITRIVIIMMLLVLGMVGIYAIVKAAQSSKASSLPTETAQNSPKPTVIESNNRSSLHATLLLQQSSMSVTLSNLYSAAILVTILSIVIGRWLIFSNATSKKIIGEEGYSILITKIPVLDFPDPHDCQDSPLSLNVFYRRHLEAFLVDLLAQWLSSRESWSPIDLNSTNYGSIQGHYKAIIDENQGQPRSTDIIKSVSLIYDLRRLYNLQKLRDLTMQQQNDSVASESEGGNHGEEQRQPLHNQQRLNSGLFKEQNPRDYRSSVINQIPSRFASKDRRVSVLNDSEVILTRQFAGDNSFLFSVTHFTGAALISFEYRHYWQYLLKLFESDSNKFKYRGGKLDIEEAPAPEDIKWFNLGLKKTQVRDRVAIGNIVLAMIVVVIGMTMGLLTYLGNKGQGLYQTFKAQTTSAPVTTTDSNKYLLSSYVAQAVCLKLVYITHQLLIYVSRRLVSYEKHWFRSADQASLVAKISFSHFFVNCLLFYLVQSTFGIAKEEGMAQFGMIVCLGVPLISIVVKIIEPRIIFKAIKVWWKYRGLKEGSVEGIFQVQLNHQFERLNFQQGVRLGYLLSVLYTALFYCRWLPMVIPITAIVLYATYALDRIFLACRGTVTYDYTLRLSIKMFNKLLFAPGAYLLGIATFEGWSAIAHGPWLQVLTNAVCVLCVIIGLMAPRRNRLFRRLSEYIFGRVIPLSALTYQDNFSEGNFNETYWRANPATSLANQKISTGIDLGVHPAEMKEFFKV